MGKFNTNKVYEPFEILPPCVCPKCFKPALAYKETDTIYAMVDEDGVGSNYVADTKTIFHCLECGFTSDRFTMTDSGWRYDLHGEDEYIREMNKRNNTEEYNPDGLNYLMDIGEGFKHG